MKVQTYADVILPLPLPQEYTYAVSDALTDRIAVGMRVQVEFGKRKNYAAVVSRLHHEPPRDYTTKTITNLLDSEPICTPEQLAFWRWMASYYVCTTGEVMVAAVPAVFRLESKTQIQRNPSGDISELLLTDEESLIVDALTLHPQLTLDQISQLLSRKNVYPIVSSLIEKGIVTLHEVLEERYHAPTTTTYQLDPSWQSDSQLKVLLDNLEKKAPKQLQVLLAYLSSCQQHGGEWIEVDKNQLFHGRNLSEAALAALGKKGIFRICTKVIDRMAPHTRPQANELVLSQAQQVALEQVKRQFDQHMVTLLHGVTSSGKTLLYLHLIQEQVRQGKQVLYLVPEIGLTTQLIERIKSFFPHSVGIYHSRLSQQQRAEIWKHIFHQSYALVVGPRSALFLPFRQLGLIIVDEEHDASFKQEDPAPRYQGRDAAIYLASLFSKASCRVLLGSATPSLESYRHALQGKYGLVTLEQRYGTSQPPEILLASHQASRRPTAAAARLFSPVLLDELTACLKRNEQAILFRNRRGYVPHLQCTTCGWIAHCPSCDVRLTYHKHAQYLECHYCGKRRKPFLRCPACGSSRLLLAGFGTEKVEDELRLLFPRITVARLDLDTARSQTGYRRIISDFEKGFIQVLVGTQMVTKGLDFEKVTLVGILHADALLSRSEFRSIERGFQLMMQVSGRAGRRHTTGKVVLQTFQPNLAVYQFVLRHDYAGFYQHELEQRRTFFYPPFSRLIRVTFRHREREKAETACLHLITVLKGHKNIQVLGPAPALVPRVKNRYRMQVLIKLPLTGAILAQVKQSLLQCKDELTNDPALRPLEMIVDVDPN